MYRVVSLMEPNKKAFIIPMILWLGTYALRAVFYLSVGFEVFHFTNLNLFLIWLSGIFFAVFMLNLVKYKKNTTINLLRNIRGTPSDLVKAVYGDYPNAEYVNNILIGAEDGVQHYQHIFKDKDKGKLYSFHYATRDNREVSQSDMKDIEIIEVKEVPKLVTVYERA